MAITALPTPPLRSDPINFASRGDAFLAALPDFVTEANALAVAMNLNATNATSTTSVVIGTGAKTFTTQSGKSYQPGMYLVIADTAAPSTNSMFGQVTSYSGTALAVNVLSFSGSGTKTAWVLSQSSAGGAKPGANTDITSLSGKAVSALALNGANTDITSLSGKAVSALALNGANNDITSLDGINSINGGQLSGLRNRIINGNFAVNQRGYVSGAAVGGTVLFYGHDRWKMAASTDTYTYSTTANVTTVTIPAGKVLRQVVEGLNLESGTYTLSWAGTAQGKISAGSYGASGITGAIVGGVDTTIEFGPGTVSKVQLEFGTTDSLFEQRPYGLELMLCQRYYSTGRASARFPASAASQYASTTIPFTQIMRAAPSVPITAGSRSGGASAAATDITAINFRYEVTSGSAGDAFALNDVWTASAEL